MPTYVLCKPRPLLKIILWCLRMHGSHTLFCMCMHAQNSTIYRFAQSHAHCLTVVAGPRSTTLAVCQLHMGLLLHKARTLDLCTTPTFLNHMLVPVNLLKLHTVLCTTPTDPSLYLLVIVGVCIATYVQYANSTNSNAHQGFSYPGQIRPDCYPSHCVIQTSSCNPVSMLGHTIHNSST